MSEDRLQSFTVKEHMLPGRINTKAIAGWKGEQGYVCPVCSVVSPYFMGKCACEDWNEFVDRTMTKAGENNV